MGRRCRRYPALRGLRTRASMVATAHDGGRQRRGRPGAAADARLRRGTACEAQIGVVLPPPQAPESAVLSLDGQHNWV